jgi:aminoglycoside phosphotransferase (APT) family kinase protein
VPTRLDTCPNSTALEEALATALGGPVTITGRERNLLTSTHPSEIATCRLAGGSIVRVLCKYETDRPAHLDGGQRGGVAYEAAIYRDLLQPNGVAAPRFLGTHEDPRTGAVWLFMEYLSQAMRVQKSRQPGMMEQAARWLGGFHRSFEGRVVPSLHRHDAEYYRGWVRRVASVAEPLRDRFPWLHALCERFAEEVAPELAGPPLTAIHGEFYPSNILTCGGPIMPIDWESAAIGPGEIDFASLTEGWPAPIAADCEREYCLARWPGGAPDDFGRRVAAARMYWAVRWLGKPTAVVASDKYRRYFDYLYAAGRQLGLIGE